MNGKKHEEKHQSDKYHILVDQNPYWVDESSLNGAQIRAVAGIPANYTLYQRAKGPEEDLPIADGQSVDLTQPGTEHFFSGITETTEGLGFLPETDRIYLESKALQYDEVTVGANRAIIMKDYVLPQGRYDRECTDILVMLPPGYNDVSPDMFFTYPWVKLIPEQRYASRADVSHEFNGIQWQRWSRHSHANQWRSGIDGMHTIAARIHKALKEAKA